MSEEKIDIAKEYLETAFQLQMKGRIKAAIEKYKLSIEFYPTAEAHTYLGWAYSIQGRYDDAIGECKIAIELDKEFGNPYNDIGSYLIQLGRYDEAINWLEKSIQAQNYISRHFPYYNLGRVNEFKGDWFKAIKYYDEALKIKKPDFELAKKAFVQLTALLN